MYRAEEGLVVTPMGHTRRRGALPLTLAIALLVTVGCAPGQGGSGPSQGTSSPSAARGTGVPTGPPLLLPMTGAVRVSSSVVSDFRWAEDNSGIYFSIKQGDGLVWSFFNISTDVAGPRHRPQAPGLMCRHE